MNRIFFVVIKFESVNIIFHEKKQSWQVRWVAVTVPILKLKEEHAIKRAWSIRTSHSWEHSVFPKEGNKKLTSMYISTKYFALMVELDKYHTTCQY